jgi:hypothetical protein
VRMPRQSGQSATISEGLMTGEYTSQVTPSRPQRGGSVNGSVSRDANVAFPRGWRLASCPLNDVAARPAAASVFAVASLVDEGRQGATEELGPRHGRVPRPKG